jgi:recombination protein RecA
MTKNKVPSFLTKVSKVTEKMSSVSTQARYPTFFFDSGSCIINKIISDRYDGGFAEGRMSMIAGLSGTGKSFLLGNAIRQAQKDGYGVFVLDSEYALDEVWLGKIGVDIHSPLFSYNGVDSIADATKVLATFFNEYEKAPASEKIPYLIAIDSLDELQTDSQEEHGKKGKVVGDMGQQVKQLKKFQSTIMHRIKPLPMAVVTTKQPYMNQDGYTNKREPTIITPALRFAYSQIALLSNTLIKDNTTNRFEGINLNVYGHKTRFAKPFQQCSVEVPYETGMDWYSGVLEAAEFQGIVGHTKGSAWYTFQDAKFMKKDFNEHREAIYNELIKNQGFILDYDEDAENVLDEEGTEN